MRIKDAIDPKFSAVLRKMSLGAGFLYLGFELQGHYNIVLVNGMNTNDH